MKLTLTRTLRCCAVFTTLIAAGSLLAGPEPMSSSKNPVMEQRAVMPECTWTGFYIGGHAGYAWSDNSTWSEDGGFDETPPRLTLNLDDANGFVGGGQLGFNWQISHFVVGVEGSGGWLDLHDRVNPVNSDPLDNGASVRYDWYATGTGRIGFAWNRLLFYGKGGVDFVRVSNFASDFDSSNSGQVLVDLTDRSDKNDTEVSWTAGGGIEYCINPHWSVKAEYDYLNVNNTRSGNEDGDTFHHEHDGIHMVTAGINFRFGSF